MDMNTSDMNGTLARTAAVEKAKEAVRRVFRSYTGSLAIRFWNGETVELGTGSPRATVVFRASIQPLRALGAESWQQRQGPYSASRRSSEIAT